MLDAEAIKAKLPDIRGIETLAITVIGDRAVAAFDGRTTSTAHNADEAQMILAIRNAASLPAAPVPAAAPMQLNPPPLPTALPPAEPKVKPMASPVPGGFAAQIKAMLDGARADLANVKAEGVAQVQAAVQEHVKAGQQVKAVTASMAQTIRSETADVLAELGQISNMPPEDAQ
jgi:hypothetical protein